MNLLEIAILLTAILLILAGFFCLARSHHLLRILIGIEVGMKAVTLLMVLAGYVNGNTALADVYVITIICLEVVMMVVATGIAINLYRTYGSMDLRNIKKLKG
jgi:NADH:ubiquinone oxidoreductase subunit K